jgi:hypothetical protein
MTDPASETEKALSPDREQSGKKAPYTAPRIVSRDELEAVAAACPAPPGKAQGQGGCAIPSS